MEQTEVARGLLEASPPKLSVSWSQLLPHEARSTDHTHIRTCHHPPQSGPGQHCPGEQPDPTHWQAEPPVEGAQGRGGARQVLGRALHAGARAGRAGGHQNQG